MTKPLAEMSLTELWQLFPIQLQEHQPQWNDWYQIEKNLLKNSLKNISDLQINHIGSTAIDTIWAKPIIDILVEIPAKTNIISVKETLFSANYLLMSESDSRLSFNKGYTENGFAKKVFHLHLRYLGDRDELYFKDYLNTHPTVAKQYEKLKLTLWQKFEHDRDGYTNAKTDFIQKYTQLAKNNPQQ